MKPPLSIAMVVASCMLVCGMRDASASGPVDIEIAARGTFGTNPSSSTANPLAFGVGARAGASLLGFYAGADFAYYFGSGSARFYEPNFNQYSATERSLKIGGDLGYGFQLAFLTVRPRVGLGDLVVSSSSTLVSSCRLCALTGVAGAPPSSQDDLYMEGAVTALVPIERYFLGADVELLVIPNPLNGSCCDELETAFTFGGQAGVRF